MFRERGVFSPSIEEEGVQSAIEPLSGRQREILILVARGFTPKEIARELALSPETIRNHLNLEPRGIFQRLNTHSQAEAVFKALQCGEIALEEILTCDQFNLSAYSTLNPREVEFLEKLVDFEGKASNQDLAKSLGISHQTIRNRLHSIHGKLGTANRTQAMVFALAFQAPKTNPLSLK